MSITQELTRLGVETRYHELVSKLCGNNCDYLQDITLDDFDGQSDAQGLVISKPVGRGLLRKLHSHAHGNVEKCKEISGDEVSGRADMNANLRSTPCGEASIPACSVALHRGGGDYSSMVRCAVSGQLHNDSGAKRRKILLAVLDNSGSMRNEWALVVDAVSRVFTNELLQDPLISVNALVYNTEASEVILPPQASELPGMLLKDFAPHGITNFQSAFELAQQVIQREINRLSDIGVRPCAVDVTTLVFTDGEDTSVPPHGSKSAAATAKARAAGDCFRFFLQGTGCAAFTCIAAFGQQHNPEQCQYLSDRYFYINRKEVLSEWLSGGLDELLQSAGHCSLRLHLPKGITLAEPIPSSIGLDAHGCLDYEVWLQVDALTVDGEQGTITVDIEDTGCVALRGSVVLDSAVVADSDTLEGRLFILDSGEMQLRQIARELRGRRPSPVEMALLRERLVGVKVMAQPLLDASSDVSTRLSGRALLLARLQELETRRNRLSYALGHFDEHDQDIRQLGAVGIDAILRDASQRVSLGVSTMALKRRAEAAKMLPPPPELSKYGQTYTFDALSKCNARDVALLGDALFFCLEGVDLACKTALGVQRVKDCGNGFVSYETYMALSCNGTKSVQLDNGSKSVSHLGIPFYVSSEHYHRAKLVLPDVLRCLSCNNSYQAGTSEEMLLTLLGSALHSHLRSPQLCGVEDISLFHKLRGVFAVFECTQTPRGSNLLDEVLLKASQFIDHEDSRANANLLEMAAAGLLAHTWHDGRVTRLAEAVMEEATFRVFASKIVNMSESERLRLAWALLGPVSGEQTWLESSLEDRVEYPEIEGFNILAAAEELEALEVTHPFAYAPRSQVLVPWLLSGNSLEDDSELAHWCAVRDLLSSWDRLAEKQFKAGGIWKVLDTVMLDDDCKTDTILEQFASVLHPRQVCMKVKDVLVEPEALLRAAANVCLQGTNAGQASSESPRLLLASTLRAVVAKRTAIARKYPIRSAAYPSAQGVPHPISRERKLEMWGSPAQPTDKSLHEQVRREVHQQRAGLPLVVKEALTDKAYRLRGGRFAFPTHVDTFVLGLHRRTKDLHAHWQMKHKASGDSRKEAAIRELLLRLPWDDSDKQARDKLSKILACIWDSLEGEKHTGSPLTSALWLDDDGAEVQILHDQHNTTCGDNGSTVLDEGEQKGSSGDEDDEWKCV